MNDSEWTDDERNAEANRVEKHMTLEEIFAEAFRRGQLLAGVQADTASEYRNWLDDKLEARSIGRRW